jgi:hypothetical protein
MVAPNLIGITTVTGKTAVANAISTATSNVITNASNSGTVVKINSLLVTNTDTANNIAITASVLRSAINYRIASSITVPANSTLIAVSKDANIYLEEGDALSVIAGANNLQVVCSYEIIG